MCIFLKVVLKIELIKIGQESKFSCACFRSGSPRIATTVGA
jgi:hypothetical protein